MALLKELSASEIVDASWVSIAKVDENDYRLEIKSAYCQALKEYAERTGLVFDENKQKAICVIYKP